MIQKIKAPRPDCGRGTPGQITDGEVLLHFSVEGAQNKKHVTVNKFTLQRFESTDWSADWRQTPAVKLSALHFTWWNHFCYDPSCDKSSVNVKGVVVTKGKIVYLKSDLCCRYLLLITMSQKCL